MDNKATPITRTALSIAILLLPLLALGHAMQGVSSAVASVIFMLVVILELYGPLYFLEKWHLSPRDFGLYAHRLETLLDFGAGPKTPKSSQPDVAGIKAELKFLLIFCAIVLPIYVVAFYSGNWVIATMSGQPFSIKPALPASWGLEIILQIFAIALPEEVFYRGFLQSSLLKIWPNRQWLGPFPVGTAIILTNALFAMSHLVGTYNPLRLLTFFPGLAFSYLAYKNKSLLSAIVFHALCNLLGQALYLSLLVD
jgi:membrane protease YdiL (CAAX protease family)